jgi:hypothetical protein
MRVWVLIGVVLLIVCRLVRFHLVVLTESLFFSFAFSFYLIVCFCFTFILDRLFIRISLRIW